MKSASVPVGPCCFVTVGKKQLLFTDSYSTISYADVSYLSVR